MIGVADFVNQHKFGIRFYQMIDEYGVVEAAKRLLATKEIQTGLMRLWEMKSLSESMAAQVLEERFRFIVYTGRNHRGAPPAGGGRLFLYVLIFQ